MAITGHKNQQSLADYGELDESDHRQIGEILSTVDKTTDVHKVQPPSLPTPQAAPPNASGPVFNFNNSTVVFVGSTPTSNTSINQQYAQYTNLPCKKRYFIDSDAALYRELIIYHVDIIHRQYLLIM